MTRMCNMETFAVLLFVVGATANTFRNFVNGAGSLIGYAEEAPYNITKIHQNFEEREYPALNWVCTTTKASSEVGSHDRAMFLKLFRYVTGQNSERRVMAYVIPATLEYTNGKNGINTYVLCLFIEKAHQAHPPEPIDESVFIENRPPLTIYTRTVGGYVISESQWIDEGARLSGYLQHEGISFSLNHMYWVSYDFTFKFWNRRNEVWFAKEAEK
ncbi:hypothetical protein SK128_007303 [Halocaridina rubra]|uniref:Uncharacterized protein n=1 Tax=Halocaridina rubra TaxID=373956 RepID=A0AAN9ADW7_HALRR